MIYNETGIDISLTAAHHYKFHHQNKNNYSKSSVGMSICVFVGHSKASTWQKSTVLFCRLS